MEWRWQEEVEVFGERTVSVPLFPQKSPTWTGKRSNPVSLRWEAIVWLPGPRRGPKSLLNIIYTNQYFVSNSYFASAFRILRYFRYITGGDGLTMLYKLLGCSVWLSLVCSVYFKYNSAKIATDLPQLTWVPVHQVRSTSVGKHHRNVELKMSLCTPWMYGGVEV